MSIPADRHVLLNEIAKLPRSAAPRSCSAVLPRALRLWDRGPARRGAGNRSWLRLAGAGRRSDWVRQRLSSLAVAATVHDQFCRIVISGVQRH